MSWVTVLLSGVPEYVTLDELDYNLACIFRSNREIGTYELRDLSESSKKRLVALDFRSGYDAIAAQDQLEGYRYQMQDGIQYILRARLTKKKEHVRARKISESPSSPRSPKRIKKSLSLSDVSDNAKDSGGDDEVEATYKWLKNQKTIVKSQIHRIRKKRKLRKQEDSDSDDEPISRSRKTRSRSNSREYRSSSRERDTYKTRRKTKRRSRKWDKNFEEISRLVFRSRSSSRESSVKRYWSSSRARHRATRSRSVSRSMSRSRSRSRSMTRSSDSRSRSRTRRSGHKRSRSSDATSKDRSSYKIIIKKRKRSRNRTHRSKRLRTSESDSSSSTSRSRNKCRALAIMPKSREKKKTSKRKQSSKRKEHKHARSKFRKIDRKSHDRKSLDRKVYFKNSPINLEIENVERSATRSDETTIQLICDDIMFFMKLQLLEITIEDNILLSENAKKIIMERYYVIAQERVRAIYVDTRMTIHNAWEIYRSIYTREDDIKLLKFIISDCLFQEAHVVKTEIQDSTSVASPPVDVTAVKKEKTSLPTNPQFAIVIKRLMRQLKSPLERTKEKGLQLNTYYMKQVLKILLTDMLNGQGYKTSCEIVILFRQKYPRDKDDEFVQKVAEDIMMKKYDLDGRDCQYDNDVIVLKNEPDVVSIADSDDESGAICKEMSADTSSSIDLTTNQVSSLSEKQAAKETVNSNAEPKENIQTNEINKSQKTNEVENNSNTEVTEVCTSSAVIKKERKQPGETEKDKTGDVYAGNRNLELNNAITAVNNEVQETEIEPGEIVEDDRGEPLKVTAITIMTSKSELHSIAHGIENKEKTHKEILKKELGLESIDEQVEKILNFEGFSLDIDFNKCNTSDPTKLESSEVESSGLHENCDGHNADITNDACEKEAPQVTAITIMTSASELLSLTVDGNGKTVKEVPEVKVENIEDATDETAVQLPDNVESEAIGGVKERVDNITNTGIVRPETQDKKRLDNEEETIESICKCVTSLCDSF